MSEKRFEFYSDDFFVGAYDNVTQEKINVLKSIDLLNSLVKENEQLRQQLQEYKENWDSLVEKASEISVRNIELVEENARLQKKIDWLCEVFDYGSDESMQKVKEYEKSNR